MVTGSRITSCRRCSSFCTRSSANSGPLTSFTSDLIDLFLHKPEFAHQSRIALDKGGKGIQQLEAGSLPPEGSTKASSARPSNAFSTGNALPQDGPRLCAQIANAVADERHGRATQGGEHDFADFAGRNLVALRIKEFDPDIVGKQVITAVRTLRRHHPGFFGGIFVVHRAIEHRSDEIALRLVDISEFTGNETRADVGQIGRRDVARTSRMIDA